MTPVQKRRRRPRLLLAGAALALALGFLVGPGVNVAHADLATDEQAACPINTFIESDGTTIDFTSYAACVAAFDATQSAGLPRTGTDFGQYVGIGVGLIALGAAFVVTSRRNRQRVDA